MPPLIDTLRVESRDTGMELVSHRGHSGPAHWVPGTGGVNVATIVNIAVSGSN